MIQADRTTQASQFVDMAQVGAAMARRLMLAAQVVREEMPNSEMHRPPKRRGLARESYTCSAKSPVDPICGQVVPKPSYGEWILTLEGLGAARAGRGGEARLRPWLPIQQFGLGLLDGPSVRPTI